jgi:hypothetical protein
MYPNPKGNRELVNSLVNGLFIFCIRKGLPLHESKQARIGVELFSGSTYKDLLWVENRKKGRSTYRIIITEYSSTHGVFRILKDGKESRFMHKELMQCIEEELLLAISHAHG